MCAVGDQEGELEMWYIWGYPLPSSVRVTQGTIGLIRLEERGREEIRRKTTKAHFIFRNELLALLMIRFVVINQGGV